MHHHIEYAPVKTHPPQVIIASAHKTPHVCPNVTLTYCTIETTDKCSLFWNFNSEVVSYDLTLVSDVLCSTLGL